MTDTIFAQATAPGRAGIAVIRISGPDAEAAVRRLTPAPLGPRRASLRRLRLPETGEVIDEAIALLFPAPGSFTGETIVELHCHGSRAVVARLLGFIGAMPGLRPAQPGEFTRRALENGRLDLTQVEGLADLLSAETEAQRLQAQRTASGHLSARAAAWRERIVGVLAHVEAAIDFSDDGVEDEVLDPLGAPLAAIAAEMAAALAGAGASERIRDGYVVAICGAPNVGKSTLLNAIAGRDVAITSEVAGTTRDVIEVQVDLGGLPVTLLDTAGLRETEDRVEALGIERAMARMAAADLRVFLVEDGVPVDETHMQEEDLVIRSKADLGVAGGPSVSGVTGAGVPELLAALGERLAARAAAASGLASRRQQAAVAEALQRLEAARELLADPVGREDLLAHELRAALRGLDVLVGRVDVETVLDVVFRDFCLGK